MMDEAIRHKEASSLLPQSCQPNAGSIGVPESYSLLPKSINVTPSLSLHQLLVHFGVPVVMGRINIVEITPKMLEQCDGKEHSTKKSNNSKGLEGFQYEDSEESDNDKIRDDDQKTTVDLISGNKEEVKDRMDNANAVSHIPSSSGRYGLSGGASTMVENELKEKPLEYPGVSSSSSSPSLSLSCLPPSSLPSSSSSSSPKEDVNISPSTNPTDSSTVHPVNSLHNFSCISHSFPLCYTFKEPSQLLTCCFLGSLCNSFFGSKSLRSLPNQHYFRADKLYPVPFSTSLDLFSVPSLRKTHHSSSIISESIPSSLNKIRTRHSIISESIPSSLNKTSSLPSSSSVTKNTSPADLESKSLKNISKTRHYNHKAFNPIFPGSLSSLPPLVLNHNHSKQIHIVNLLKVILFLI
jgi:hypothetical protein